MLWASLPTEVLAAWSTAAVPDVDFHELSLSSGPTWSLPHAAAQQTPVCHDRGPKHKQTGKREAKRRGTRQGLIPHHHCLDCLVYLRVCGVRVISPCD